MRDIKFRLFDTAGVYYDGGFSVDMDMYAWHDDNDHQHLLRDGRYILEQFSGMQDKFGVDIYEGDVVEYTTRFWTSMGSSKVTYRSAVEFEDACFVVSGYQHNNQGLYCVSANCVVIGNIHHPIIRQSATPIASPAAAGHV
jgi:hypothetical protein